LPRSGKLFDAIIADVPCSGDATIRKDKFILPMWSPATGNALHGLQLKILIRALELVRVGGVVCYSTCSLNPVEDEAVVSAALRKVNGKKATVCDGSTESDDGDSPAVELMEWPSSLLPTFKRQPGVSDWKIATYEQGQNDDNDGGNGSDEGTGDDFGTLRYFASYEDARKAGMEQAKKTMWPKNDEGYMHLELCSRLLPQAQDTGGFFVALLKRNR
jgi:16S rRNA C967 or C1407 C5-methylase (RsmB/RsmF family)